MISIRKGFCCSMLLFTVANAAQASCGAAFCSLSSDWRAQGVWVEPGWQADVRYEFIDQDRPYAGSQRVAVGEVRRHHDEVRTLNRNTLLGLEYNFADGMGVTLQLPWVSRQHQHIHNHHGDQELESWDISDLGDARVNLRLPLMKDSGFGLNLGVKLPTGRIDSRNGDGESAERTLQPGSGSTDTILGFNYHSHPDTLTWFAQTSWQHAVTTREDYRPGDRVNLDLGLRYAFSEHFSGVLQANFQKRQHDRGVNAEPEDTGGRFAYLSPGVSYAIGRNTQVYGFVQLPVYTYVNGVQLTPSKTFSVGFSQRF